MFIKNVNVGRPSEQVRTWRNERYKRVIEKHPTIQGPNSKPMPLAQRVLLRVLCAKG